MEPRKRIAADVQPEYIAQRLSAAAPETSPWVTHVYECELVTPMYGGGVRPGEPDRDLPVRATSIRGQLRFWWRLLNRRRPDGSVVSPQELRIAERQVWGGLVPSDLPVRSNVIVQVTDVCGFDTAPYATYTHPNGQHKSYPHWADGPALGYALFPSQGRATAQEVVEPPRDLARPGLRFTLVVKLRRVSKTSEPCDRQPERPAGLSDEQAAGVIKAIHAWLVFGGLGARTRRGCGSLSAYRCDGGQRIAVTEALVGDVSAAGLKVIKLRASYRGAFEPWKAAIELLRDFRQAIGFARDSGTSKGRPGRSRWPEPDAIRRLTGRHSTGHEPDHPANNVFPRAYFGLPIITKFKDDTARQPDPFKTELVPRRPGKDEAETRLASPVVVRALRVTESEWCSAVIKLPLEHVDGMGLELRGSGDVSASDFLPVRMLPGSWWSSEAAANVWPLAKLADHPIEAFIKFFRRRGTSHPRNTQPNVRTPTGATAAGSGASATNAATTTPSQLTGAEQVWVRPAIKLQSNGVLTIEPQRGQGKKITMPQQDAQRFMERLSDHARRYLTTNDRFYNRCELTVRNGEVVGIKELPQ